MQMDADLLSIQEARNIVNAAHQAYKQLKTYSQQQIDQIVNAIAEATRAQAQPLAESAVSETGFGRVKDKMTKNLFSSVNVYNHIRDMRTVGYISDNQQAKVQEIAVPMGVVAAIIPSTNPTSTAIYKALIAIKAGNSVVMSPHPSAKDCINKTCEIMIEAAQKAGAPEGTIGCLSNPTLPGTQELWSHKHTSVILATGGSGLVKAAYSAGKPAYGVGPGNVPAFIERSANVKKAVRDVIAGKSFDWGTVCASEQSMLVDAPIREEVIRELKKNKAYLCTDEEKAQIQKHMITANGGINPKFVGKSPQFIASQCGMKVPESTEALIVFLNDVGASDPLSCEKLSPVLGFYTVNGWREGCELAIRLLEFGGIGHTMAIHSGDEDIIRQFGLEKPAFRIVVNTPSTHGAIGLTTGLTPAMTLGPGTWGGSITSDNISPLHLINIKRLAREIQSVDELGQPGVAESKATAEQPVAAEEAIADSEIDRIIASFVAERKGS